MAARKTGTSWRLLVAMFAGWVNRGQQASIEYLKDENRVLRELHGARRLRFNDEQRARLARKARAVLREIGSLVTPDTLMRWYRRLIAHKYDGTGRWCMNRNVAASSHSHNLHQAPIA